MTFLGFLLVGLSAFTHATWNFLCKSRTPSAAFFLVATTVSLGFLLPTLPFSAPAGPLPLKFYLLLAATGLAQTFYYTMLGNAYRLNDISVAYPMARSIPVVLTPLITGALGLGEPLTAAAIAGMLLVFAGCMTLPQKRFRNLFQWRNYGRVSFLIILGAAVGTAVYSVIDSEEIAMLPARTPFRTALFFLTLENLAIELPLAAYVFTSATERCNLRTLLRKSPSFPAAAGLVCSGGYLLVLAAMTQATNVSYVVAFRQLSIPIGALLGVRLLREPLPRPKVAGLILLLAGLAIIAFCRS